MSLINDELKGRIASEVAAVTRLETKLTLLVGFVVTAIPLLLSRKLELITGLAALAALVFALCISLDGLRPRRWAVVPEPQPFVEELGGSSRIEILGVLIGTRVDAFEGNKRIGEIKGRRMHQALIVLLLAALLSGASVNLGRADTAEGSKGTNSCKVNASEGDHP
ncbi:hypothetical protein ACIF83_14925 [Streptomyces sp. NPDC085866]|uniref:hypothetical protein n=1 Tax=Streptomyces sp. NPDC085866 TaxID=3365736 RepID=UPI0037CDE3CC